MTREMIARINALAKKKREQGLTPAEQAEQKELYAAYLADIRGQVTAQLDAVRIKESDGSQRPLERKPTLKH
jgi:uncharacterized protein YnzC (UPF0291/DUF896 family)